MTDCLPKPLLKKGEDKVLTLRFRDRSTGDIMVITGGTVTGKFPKDDGSNLSKAGSITDGANGVATITLTTAETATLEADPNYDFEVVLVVSGTTYIVPFTNSLNVEESLS